MVFVLFVDLLSVLLIDGSLGITELSFLLQFLFLKGLVLSSILEHGLRILITTSLHLSLILIVLHLQLLIELLLNLIFGALHLVDLRPDVVLQVSLLSLHLLDHLLLIVCRILVINGTTAWVAS